MKIIVSTILPRVSNLRSTGTFYSCEELVEINEDINTINKKLKEFTKYRDNVFVVEHPQFVGVDGKINDSLLAADGLHFSFEGTRVAVENIESAIIEVRKVIEIPVCVPLL